MFPDEQPPINGAHSTVDAEPSPQGSPLPKGSKFYLGGCKALDLLSRMITSTESFFHPSNSGSWTSDLSAFIKYLASEFNKRKSHHLGSYIPID